MLGVLNHRESVNCELPPVPFSVVKWKEKILILRLQCNGVAGLIGCRAIIYFFVVCESLDLQTECDIVNI